MPCSCTALTASGTTYFSTTLCGPHPRYESTASKSSRRLSLELLLSLLSSILLVWDLPQMMQCACAVLVTCPHNKLLSTHGMPVMAQGFGTLFLLLWIGVYV